MFNKVTADILRMLPPVKGVDIERMPQLLSKVYAHIVGLKTKYKVGILEFEAEEIGDDYRILSELAFTLELYLESGKFEEKQNAIAYVAAMSHKLMDKLKTRQPEALDTDAIPADVAAILMFIVGGYIADAEELANRITRYEGESDAGWQLKTCISLLAKGKLKELLEIQEARLEVGDLELYAQELLWIQLTVGIKAFANKLLGGEGDDWQQYVRSVIQLATFKDEGTGYRFDFVGVSRLGHLLLMAMNVLEHHSLLRGVKPYLITSHHYELILHKIVQRPYLWQNHINAIEQGFLKAGVSSVITFPTGAGKSTLLELKILQHVAVGGQAVYLVPTHALEYQVKGMMEHLLQTEEYKDISLGKEFTTEEEDDEPVKVMTPERCSTLLALKPSAFEGVTLVVMDEFHIIGEDGHRSLGAMFCLVSLLSTVPDADFVLSSAMVENGNEMSEWIADVTGRTCLNLSMAWKPTSQLQGCVVYPLDRCLELRKLALQDKQNRGNRKGPSSNLKKRLTATPYCLFSLQNTWESDKMADYYLTPVLDHDVTIGVNKFWNLIGNRNQVAKELAKKFSALGMKIIVFVENPAQANSLVKQLDGEIGLQSYPATLQRKIRSIYEELGNANCTYIKDEMGAVPHHSLLLPEERHVMETLFRGKHNIMVATATLAQGVNLPVDVVLIAGEDRYDVDKDGRGQMDAHEILNAAGRAGRAGFRSQGAAILVSNSVIGIQNNELTDAWFSLKNNIFSKGDNCLTVNDPFGKLMEEVEVSKEQKLVLMKLNLAGENERRILSKSLYAFQLRKRKEGTDEFLEKMVHLSSQYGEVGRDALLELSLKSGIDRQLLEDFYHWLKESNADRALTVIDLLKLYCCWLFERPVALKELLIYESTLEQMLKLFGDGQELNVNFIRKLYAVLKRYVMGCDLQTIGASFDESKNDPYLTQTRKFVIKVLPELSYAFSVLAMVHIQVLKEFYLLEEDIPMIVKNFATYLKEGVTSEDMLRFKTERRMMRVEVHRRFKE